MMKALRSETSTAITLNLSLETVRELKNMAITQQTRVSLLTEKLLAEALGRRSERQRLAALLVGAVHASGG